LSGVLSETEVLYPEHEKLLAVNDQSQAIGEFLDYCGYTLCEARGARWYPVGGGITKILADYFDIDLAAIEREKRAMLAAIRTTSDRAPAVAPESDSQSALGVLEENE
jgi:hypothetical protein